MRLLCFHSDDARLVSEVEADLRGSGDFTWVGNPAGSQWVVAHEGPSTLDRREELFFVEGSDELADVGSKEVAQRTRDSTLSELPGDFTFACFPNSTEAQFVRSAAGTAPLFVWHGRGCVGVSSRLTDLTRYFPEEPRLDPLANAILGRFACLPPSGRTPLENVRLVEIGTGLVWDRQRGFRSQAWWSPPAMERPRRRLFDEHAAALQSLLLTSMDRSLDRSTGNLLTFSGGFDSSILAWLAAKRLGRDFVTLTMTPPAGPDLDAMRSRTDSVLGGLGGRVLQRFEREVSPQTRLTYARQAPRVVWYVGHPVLCLLPEIAAEVPLRCFFGGEYCDELLGGGPALYDWAFSTSAAGALRRFPESFTRVQGLRYWAKMQARRLARRSPLFSSLPPPAFATPDLAEEYIQSGRDAQSAFARDTSERPYLSYRLYRTGAAKVQNWEVASGLGIRRVFPFLNRGTMELAYRCHPTELTGKRPKRLVRASVTGLVPESVLEPPKDRGTRTYASLDWSERMPEELVGIVRNDWLESPPRCLPAEDALHVQAVLNIIQATRTCRQARRDLKK